MTATTTLTAPATTPAPSHGSTTKQIRRTGVVAGLAASVATSSTAAVASALDTPRNARSSNAGAHRSRS